VGGARVSVEPISLSPAMRPPSEAFRGRSARSAVDARHEGSFLIHGKQHVGGRTRQP
jgi:hypothetical protein